MDENKNSTPESTPEEKNIKAAQPAEGEAAPPEANTAGPGEGKNKRSLRNTILTCISIALVLFAAIIVLRQYVYLPGKYEAGFVNNIGKNGALCHPICCISKGYLTQFYQSLTNS